MKKIPVKEHLSPELDISVSKAKVHKGETAPEGKSYYTVKAKIKGKVLSKTKLGPSTFEFDVKKWAFKGELIKEFRKEFRI